MINWTHLRWELIIETLPLESWGVFHNVDLTVAHVFDVDGKFKGMMIVKDLDPELLSVPEDDFDRWVSNLYNLVYMGGSAKLIHGGPQEVLMGDEKGSALFKALVCKTLELGLMKMKGEPRIQIRDGASSGHLLFSSDYGNGRTFFVGNDWVCREVPSEEISFAFLLVPEESSGDVVVILYPQSWNVNAN